MARAHVMRPITGENGDLLYGAQVTVRESGMSVKVAQPLYAGPTGSQTLTNPYVSASGVIDFWLEQPQRVSVLVEADGHSDILVYLDAAPPPEETARTDSPLLIVGEQAPGHVLMAGDTPGQAVWGNPPSSTGITPLVTVINEDFILARDPAGWTFTQAASTTRDYVAEAPEEQGLSESLHVRHTGNSGSLVARTPGFTLAEPGYVSVWLRLSQVTSESTAIAVTNQVGTKTVLETITGSRGWGFYRYALAAGTYQSLSVEVTGAPVFTGTSGHEVWVTGVRAQYGGQVPAHGHTGAGSNSVLLGTGASATGNSAVGVGTSAQASAADAIAIGRQAKATATDTVAVGNGASATSVGSVAVGARASGNLANTGWTAVGVDSYSDAQNGTAVGRSAKVYGSDGTAVGSSSYVGPGAAGAVALGRNAQALAVSSVALGPEAVVAESHVQSVAIGQAAATSAAAQVMLGAVDQPRAVIIGGQLYALTSVNVGTDATSRLGFFGAEGTVKPVVTGSDGGNLALRNLLGALAGLGLIVNNTTN
ncbi:hypothetical protein [Streptomyces griseoaurantiacus]|uniref:hypothetical protein n=1 Tax=Streptomyces griseoaurantiacus TaxID=68213 RepID=UPI0036863DB5